MQFVDGIDLKQLITERGRLPLPKAAEVISQIGDGLDAAHARGLVHRDVKPANILIEPANGDHAYLTDFGLTKVIGSQSGPTHAGGIVGTLDYIAPEQIRGDPVDARADIYALGGVLFNAVTGEVPYPRDSDPAKLFAHVSEDPPSVARVAPDLPAAIGAIVDRAMAKDPDDRYQSAGDLGAAVSRVAGSSTVVRPERTVATGAAAVPKAGGSHRRAIVIAALIAAVAGLATAIVVNLAAGGDSPGNPAGTVVGDPVRAAVPSDLAWDIRAGDGYAFVGKRPRTAGGRDTVARIDARTMKVTDPFYSESDADTRVSSQRLEVADGQLWIDSGLDHVTRVDVRTGKATDVPMPAASPSRKLMVTDGAVWILDPDKRRVVTLDARTGALKGKPVPLPAAPNPLWDVGGGYAWVPVDRGTVLAVGDGKLLKTRLGSDARTAVTFVNGTLYTAIDRKSFGRYDIRTDTVGTPLRIPKGAAEAFAFRGSDVWAIYPLERVARRFDATSGKQIGTDIELPRTPLDIAASAEGVWILNQDGTVTKIRP